MPAISNADIMTSLNHLTAEVAVIRTIGEATKLQAEKTNGRVTTIENWRNGLMAIDQYKKENPTQTVIAPNATTVVTNQPQKWFQSKELVGGVVALLLAIAGAVGIWATIVQGVPK